MGHIGTRAMLETSKVTEGMPPFPTDTSHFKCPFCDKAKIQKRKGKKRTLREVYQPGQMFHMDLGFIHDSKIIRQGKTTKRQTLLKDRKGHTAYLIIVDAASKYIWVFPLTSKQPPLNIIKKFLDRHGRAQGKATQTITTTPHGALATSNQFNELLQTRGIQKKEEELDLDFDTTPPESLRHIVRTDNGGELAGSKAFQNLIGEAGYTLETTAPGTSSMNGMAERPNRTLKERVRCLLYMAGLGVEFWADALIHAVWLYNRTYHSAIKRTPYEHYTGRRPLLDKLLTFGCRITARKPGERPTALSTHSYDGIFLGYSAHTNKVIYWDPTTQKEKTALTPNADELHYGTAPSNRPPAAKHLIETITNTPHEQLSSHEMKEKEKYVRPTADTTDHLTAEQLLDASPLPYSAAAAKVIIPPNEKILLSNLDTLNISLNLFEPAVSETIPLWTDHPTAGLILKQHPEFANTVTLHSIKPGTTASKHIKNWRSRLRGSIVRMLDEETIQSPQHFRQILQEKKTKNRHHATTITIQFAHPKWGDMNGEGLPTMAFDQLNVVAHHLSAIEQETPHSWDSSQLWPPIRDEDIPSIIHKGLALPKLTRRKLQQDSTDWPKFQESEWTQLAPHVHVQVMQSSSLGSGHMSTKLTR